MKGPMTLKHRKNIVREAKNLIKTQVKDYESRPIGEREVILDEFIEQVSIEKGWSLAHFYFEDGKILNRILN